MRLFYAVIILALFLTAGCAKPSDQQTTKADPAPKTTQTTADVQYVKLNLPNMT
ncbi:MAG: hypothetical protein WBF93_06900 [Pirellulales bacterium]